jgi:hypothetical protein
VEKLQQAQSGGQVAQDRLESEGPPRDAHRHLLAQLLPEQRGAHRFGQLEE